MLLLSEMVPLKTPTKLEVAGGEYSCLGARQEQVVQSQTLAKVVHPTCTFACKSGTS